jgi:hypothetical protein
MVEVESDLLKQPELIWSPEFFGHSLSALAMRPLTKSKYFISLSK